MWLRTNWETWLLVACLMVYAFVAAPIPALNEPHYLGKAKHYWQPDWCSSDFFLQSANAHPVFFATVGWLTTVCSLPTTAVLGRFLALSTLAAGWSALGQTLFKTCIREDDATSRKGDLHPRESPSLWGFVMWSVWLFLALATVGNWSGEWLVGGVESKVFAYGGLFWAWSQLPAQRWAVIGPALGAAVAMHPVVGLWGSLATLGAWFWSLWLPLPPSGPDASRPERRDVLRRWSGPAGLLTGLLLSGLGLVPVLKIVLEPVDAATRYAGTYIQVYYRLSHHLDPMQFPWRAHAGYAVLIAIWLLGWRIGPRGPVWSWLHRLTACSLVFAMGGFLLGWGPRPPHNMPGYAWRMHLLKFYPFRLADVLLPLSCSFLTAWLLTRQVPRRAFTLTGLGVLMGSTLFGAYLAVQDQRYTRSQHPDWQAACRWIKSHAPPEAVVIPPHGQWTFKWYGERAEFVNFKDCPQDVRGIVEWNRRQLLLTRWYQQQYADGRYSREELRLLRRLTGADFLIADETGPFDLPPVYQNATHRVYDLRVTDEAVTAGGAGRHHATRSLVGIDALSAGGLRSPDR